MNAKHVQKVLFNLLGILVLVGLLVSACAPKAAPTPTPEATPTKPAPTPTPVEAKKVTITIWHQWGGDYLKAIEAAFKDYRQRIPT